MLWLLYPSPADLSPLALSCSYQSMFVFLSYLCLIPALCWSLANLFSILFLADLQASIEVRDAGTRTLSMLQSTNPNFRSLDLSLAPTVAVSASSGCVPTASSAEGSLSGSIISTGCIGIAQDEDTCDTKLLTRTRAYASVSQPQSPRHRVRPTPNGLHGRSTSISSQLEKTKKLLKMTEGEDKPLTILHYNDVYNIESMAETEPIGGAARFATAIKSYAHLNPLVLFSGDAFSPSMRE